MKTYNYYYFGTPITKKQFESNVPSNWKSQVDEFGAYSWGGYRANEIGN